LKKPERSANFQDFTAPHLSCSLPIFFLAYSNGYAQANTPVLESLGWWRAFDQHGTCSAQQGTRVTPECSPEAWSIVPFAIAWIWGKTISRKFWAILISQFPRRYASILTKTAQITVIYELLNGFRMTV